MRIFKYFENNTSLNLQEPIISYARQLRKDQTSAEKYLWKRLRNRRFHEFKFRRQHPISNLYILDFYCFESNLAVELDGKHHKVEPQYSYDKERTGILNMLGIKVIRFSNEEIFKSIDEVLKKILEECNERRSLPHPNRSPD